MQLDCWTYRFPLPKWEKRIDNDEEPRASEWDILVFSRKTAIRRWYMRMGLLGRCFANGFIQELIEQELNLEYMG